MNFGLVQDEVQRETLNDHPDRNKIFILVILKWTVRQKRAVVRQKRAVSIAYSIWPSAISSGGNPAYLLKTILDSTCHIEGRSRNNRLLG